MGISVGSNSTIEPNPAWRQALPWETPGQLEPQLKERPEPKVHVLNDNMQPYCGVAIYGDKGITLEQAREDNDMFFDCEACFKILSGDDDSPA